MARKHINLSREANARLKWMDYYQRHGRNARLTCRRCGISPQTFYRWKRRYDPKNLRTLEDRSRRPKRCRRPEYKPELAMAVQKLREQYPRWGKDKLVVLVRREGFETSASTVDRILHRLKARGVLVEPVWSVVSRPRRRVVREYATRKPKGYSAEKPGDLVQVDTMDIRLKTGKVFKQFTARDVVSRWDTLGISTRATAKAGAAFVEEIVERMPFGVKAIQVDGGSEFYAEFERACKGHGIRVFVLPPRSPKLNGSVERANRTHTEEFYEVYPMTYTVAGIRAAQSTWEETYNRVRPHQALNYLTPSQYLERHGILGKGNVSPRC